MQNQDLCWFACYSIKNLAIKYLYKLRNADQKFAGINVAHNMTPKERSKYKRFVSEAEQQEADDSSGD